MAWLSRLESKRHKYCGTMNRSGNEEEEEDKEDEEGSDGMSTTTEVKSSMGVKHLRNITSILKCNQFYQPSL